MYDEKSPKLYIYINTKIILCTKLLKIIIYNNVCESYREIGKGLRLCVVFIGFSVIKQHAYLYTKGGNVCMYSTYVCVLCKGFHYIIGPWRVKEYCTNKHTRKCKQQNIVSSSTAVIVCILCTITPQPRVYNRGTPV